MVYYGNIRAGMGYWDGMGWYIIGFTYVFTMCLPHCSQSTESKCSPVRKAPGWPRT